MSTPALPGIFQTVEPLLNHYGYLAVALFVTVEDFGIPVPGETILIAAALFAGAGRLNVILVGVVATLAAIVGDNIGFAIGHFGGRALALRFGKYLFLTEERLDRAENFFEHHGGKIIVVARFIEGLRQANGIVAGISGMHWRRFLAFNALGAALWTGVWVSLGYLAGNHITTIYNQITRYSLYALIALAVVVVAFIVRRRLRRRRARQAPGIAEAGEQRGTPEAGGTPEALRSDGASRAPETDGTDGAPEIDGVSGNSGTPGTGRARGTGEAPGAGGADGGGHGTGEAPGADGADRGHGTDEATSAYGADGGHGTDEATSAYGADGTPGMSGTAGSGEDRGASGASGAAEASRTPDDGPDG